MACDGWLCANGTRKGFTAGEPVLAVAKKLLQCWCKWLMLAIGAMLLLLGIDKVVIRVNEISQTCFIAMVLYWPNCQSTVTKEAGLSFVPIARNYATSTWLFIKLSQCSDVTVPACWQIVVASGLVE